MMSTSHPDTHAKAYPEDTYWSRVKLFRQRMNPLLLFASEADIQNAKHIGALADAGSWDELRKLGITEKELRAKILLRGASINPSSGEVLPLVLRLAAFAPVNIPICAGLLLSAPTVTNCILWQWINQTYNAAFNYANGNRPQDEKYKEQQKASIVKGYSAAVVVSVGLAVGLNTWLRRLDARPTVMKILQTTVPFTAVAGANLANVFFMRGHECFRVGQKGIPVSTEGGRCLGVSRRAGFVAVKQTAISRVVLPLPILLLPTPLISFFNVVFPITRSNSFLKVATDLSVIFGCLNIGLPLAVGIFPTTTRIPVSKLEPEFQGLLNEDGTHITHVVFNRGI